MTEENPLFEKINHQIEFEKKTVKHYFFFTPLFFILSVWVGIKKIVNPKIKINFYFFDGISNLCREVKNNATNWKALDLTYNDHAISSDNLGEKVYGFYWRNLNSSQALRNRLKCVKFFLKTNIEKIGAKKREVRIISIASGSAQGVIECMSEAKNKGIKVSTILIDLDETSFTYARQLAQRYGVENQIKFVCDKASAVSRVGKEFKPNLVEMVGFLEYRPKEKAVKLVKSIYDVLENNGTFITSQVANGIDRLFMEKVLNWSMIYRAPVDSLTILRNAGFARDDCKFFWEPFKIHYTMECKKA